MKNLWTSFVSFLLFRRVPCERCQGCGKLSSSGWGEPWVFAAPFAIEMGLVPVDCEECGGAGEKKERRWGR